MRGRRGGETRGERRNRREEKNRGREREEKDAGDQSY